MEGRIIFIDGYCVLCNGLANFILKHNKDKSISIASLQGETAKNLLPAEQLKAVDTVIYLKNRIVYKKSSAALHVLSDLGTVWKLLKVFFIFPKFIRDWVYDHIATHRYKWFGKMTPAVCQMNPIKTEF